MQGGDDCIHGSYALYESPVQKKAKTGSKPELQDEKPLHRLLDVISNQMIATIFWILNLNK